MHVVNSRKYVCTRCTYATKRTPEKSRSIHSSQSSQSDEDHEDDEDEDEDEDEDDDEEEEEEDDDEYDDEEELVVIDEEGGVAARGLSAAEQSVVDAFLGGGAGERRTLADIIMEKLAEKEDEAAEAAAAAAEGGSSLPPKVVEVYTAIGKLLRTYRSGKLPKALKMVPALRYWEEVTLLMRPDQWSPHAMLAVTRIFASNLNEKLAQRFFNMVLLQACRDNIATYKKLNYHLYMALKKCVYKPGAFFKGILLPLADSGTCTLREATIIGSVLARVSIPVAHSSIALFMLARMRYTPAASIFMRVLINKKYSLPRQAVAGVVDHFCRFETETRQLPVLWHQGLLAFAQRYKAVISDEQHHRLLGLLRSQNHWQISNEVRRELIQGRKMAAAAAAAGVGVGDGAVTMRA